MTELEIEELERNLAENDICKEKEKKLMIEVLFFERPEPCGNRLRETGITVELGQVQKTVLLATARILRKLPKI